jgi:hypothetical protein
MDDLFLSPQGNNYEIRAIKPPLWDAVAQQVTDNAREISMLYQKEIRYGMGDTTAYRNLREALERCNSLILVALREYEQTYVVTAT